MASRPFLFCDSSGRASILPVFGSLIVCLSMDPGSMMVRI
jgi:hypothetical protein